MAEFDQFVRQEPKRPSAPTRRRASTGQGDEVGFLVAIEQSRTAWYGSANEGNIKTAFDERAADPVDGDRSEVQGVTDLFV
jgi:hypothetical protein